MPWDVVKRGEQWCVIKKTTGKTMKCYSQKSKAVAYFQALEINASEHKQVLEMMLKEHLDQYLEVKELDDGRYWIVAIATAALRDKEGETFETAAMDYDIEMAEQSKSYPLFTMWHHKGLAIGEVHKMSRVGLFAVDEGPSYDDPFSLSVCKEIIAKNDGRWGISRGFYVLEASGACPVCKSGLVVGLKQMIAGFKCPRCKAMHFRYKGVLKEVHFRKTRTFEDTITDIPAVPYTGVSAYSSKEEAGSIMEVTMLTKEQLKEKLLAEGVDEAAVDARLETIGEKELKELGNEIPYAALLKEFEEEDGDVEYFVLDPATLKEFTDGVDAAVETKLKELLAAPEFKEVIQSTVEDAIVQALDGVEFDLGDDGLELKEVPGLVELKDAVDHITEVLEELAQEDTERMKQQLGSTSRAGKFRILRSTKEGKMPPGLKKKVGKKGAMDEEEEGEEEQKQLDGAVYTADGQYGSMTEALIS